MTITWIDEAAQIVVPFLIEAGIRTSLVLLVVVLAALLLGSRHPAWRSLACRLGIVSVFVVPAASVLLPNLPSPIPAPLVPAQLQLSRPATRDSKVPAAGARLPGQTGTPEPIAAEMGTRQAIRRPLRAATVGLHVGLMGAMALYVLGAGLALPLCQK